MFAISLAVDYSFTGDRDVALLKGIDESGIAHQLHAFPASEDHRQILLWVLTEFDRGVSGEVKIDIALQVNCAGEKFSRRNHDASAAGFVARVDGFGECCGAIGFAVTHSAELGNRKIARGEDWCLDARENLRSLRPGIIVWNQSRACRINSADDRIAR